jgi:very-short-patch-repair endonuclease
MEGAEMADKRAEEEAEKQAKLIVETFKKEHPNAKKYDHRRCGGMLGDLLIGWLCFL